MAAKSLTKIIANTIDLQDSSYCLANTNVKQTAVLARCIQQTAALFTKQTAVTARPNRMLRSEKIRQMKAG